MHRLYSSNFFLKLLLFASNDTTDERNVAERDSYGIEEKAHFLGGERGAFERFTKTINKLDKEVTVILGLDHNQNELSGEKKKRKRPVKWLQQL